MNVVLDDPNSVPYFTDVGATLDAAGIDPAAFDWYVSDLETNFTHDALPASAGWMTGEAVSKLLSTPGLQFIWVVFSAFPRGVRYEVIDEPCADGNPEYWTNADLKPQLAGALFEVVSWDSSATLLVGVPEQAACAYLLRYPQAKAHTAVVRSDA